MRSFQDKVLALLESDAAQFGLETVQQQNWGNTGRVLAQRPGDLATVAWFSYEFSTGSVIAFNSDNMQQRVDAQGNTCRFYFKADHSDMLDSMRSYWNELLYNATKGA